MNQQTNQMIESSVAVRAGRWLIRDSFVASGVRSVLGIFSSVDRAFDRAAAEKEARVDPARVEAMLKSSAIVRAIDAVFSAPFAAWEHARVRPFVDDVRSSVAAMPLVDRIRLLGWMLAVALATRAILYVLSRQTLTGATLAVWALVLLVALFMMTAPRQIAAGWAEWKRRKG